MQNNDTTVSFLYKQFFFYELIFVQKNLRDENFRRKRYLIEDNVFF